MFCKNCGAELDDNARFCASCGQEIQNKENVTAQTQESVAVKPIRKFRSFSENKTGIAVLVISFIIILSMLVADVFSVNCDRGYDEESRTTVSVFEEVDIDHQNSSEAEDKISSLLKVTLVIAVAIVVVFTALFYTSYYDAAAMALVFGFIAYFGMFCALDSVWSDYKNSGCSHSVLMSFGSVVMLIGCALLLIIAFVQSAKADRN